MSEVQGPENQDRFWDILIDDNFVDRRSRYSLREMLAMAYAEGGPSEGAELLARITVDVTERKERGIGATEVLLGRREYKALVALLLRYGDAQTICGVPYRVVAFGSYYEVLP